MKEYNFKINGNDYTVGIEILNDTEADVIVNGASYSVEVLDTTVKPSVAAKPQVAAVPASHPPAAGRHPRHPDQGGRLGSRRPDAGGARGYEDGEQYRQRPCGRCQVDQGQPRRLRAGGRRAHNSRIGLC